MDSNTEGVILYTIGKDGCLNGIYSNKDVKGNVYNEIARKTQGQDITTLEREYNCSWTDVKDTIENGILIITSTNGVYDLEWFDDKKKIKKFSGTGFFLSEKQLVVHYRSA